MTQEAPPQDNGYIPLPRSVKQKMKDIIVALSVANLCFIRSWASLLFNGNHYFDDQLVTPAELLALATNIFVLMVLIWIGLGLWRRFRNQFLATILEFLFLALLLAPLDFARTQIFGLSDANTVALLKKPLCIVIWIVVLGLIVVKHRPAARIFAMGIVVTFPMALLTLAKTLNVGLGLSQVNSCPINVTAPSVYAIRANMPRVVWIIFDETDFRLAFEKRPPGLAMPEFDRLRDSSLFSESAFAPGDRTILSMPALIVGRRLEDTKPNGCDMDLILADTHQTSNWTALPSVFSEARNLGYNTGLVGWFIPYGRLVGQSLNYCAWHAMPAYRPVAAANFTDALVQQVSSLAWPFRTRALYIDICKNTLAESLTLVGDPKYGLMLLHLPPPHFPGIYLPEEKEFTYYGIRRPAAYFNNLALADRELGEMRRKMESTGEWDKTWIIMSADHSWRASRAYDKVRDYRVPYLVKAPGPGQFLDYTNKFNTVLTHDLILSILRQQVTNQTSAKTWIDAHGKADLPMSPDNGGSE